MPQPADVLLESQERSMKHEHLRLSDWRCYSTFHGGCGMLVVCASDDDAETLVHHGAFSGIDAQVVGETIASDMGEVIITSRFKEGGRLSSCDPQ